MTQTPRIPSSVITPDQAAKRKTALRYTLAGHKLTHAQFALEDALRLHCGVRKDGVTPESAHPIQVTMQLVTLIDMLGTHEQRDEILAAALLHDVLEDKPVTREEMAAKYTPGIKDTVVSVSWKEKMQPDRVVDKAAHFASMHLNRGGPLLKAADRIHNNHSMIGVFSDAKQLAYMAETADFILPMLERHRKTWPDLLWANLNLTMTLEAQMVMLEAIHGRGGN